jgi:putative transposase
MSNHVHLMAAAKENNLSDILRDFKKFTSKQIITSIQNNEQENRKEWMLSIFKQQGKNNSRNSAYQFWRQDNQPKECYSPQFSVQKLNYIHNNPEEAGIVEKAEDYLYSSARPYQQQKKDGLLEVEFL